MSIHTISAKLTEAGVKHVVVVAKASKKFSDIKSFVSSLDNEDLSKYAQSYFDWVSGGRKGATPRAGGESDHSSWKYIRSVVSQLV
jgi:hypothetical protein